jgi:hypothetical protein
MMRPMRAGTDEIETEMGSLGFVHLKRFWSRRMATPPTRTPPSTAGLPMRRARPAHATSRL